MPQCALALEALFRDAGAPEGVFTTLLVESRQVEGIIGDRRVAAVTLTGSEGAGSHVGAAAGKYLKKSVLELGGSDPFVVMPSADVALAARTAVTARTINNGQSCIAAKRFVVHEAVYDEFTRLFVEGMRALRVGDPTAAETQVGPLATASDPTSSAWNTPSSNPARRKISSMASAHCGTFDACLSNPTFPAMSPGAAKRKTCQNGKFHGMTASTGPMGR